MALFMYKNEYFEEVLRIYVDAFTSPPLNYGFVTNEKAARYIWDIIHAPGFLGYVFKNGDKIVAFIFGSVDNYFDGTIYKIKEFAVDPKHQRVGTGTAVLKELESKLAAFGVCAMNLNTSRHLPAYAFYQKNGYTEITESVSLMKWLQA